MSNIDVSVVRDVINNFGFNGSLLAIDNIPPFMISFDYPMQGYKRVKNPEYTFASHPQGRNKYPRFVGMGEERITFSVLYDGANRNGQAAGYGDTGYTGIGPFKGPITEVNNALKLAGADYISHIKALYDQIKSPKYGLSNVVQNKIGKILNVSQGKGEPYPPLCVLIKNPSEIFMGFVESADINESNWDEMNYPNRIKVDVSFAVSPDFIFSTLKEAVQAAHLFKAAIKGMGR